MPGQICDALGRADLDSAITLHIPGRQSQGVLLTSDSPTAVLPLRTPAVHPPYTCCIPPYTVVILPLLLNLPYTLEYPGFPHLNLPYTSVDHRLLPSVHHCGPVRYREIPATLVYFGQNCPFLPPDLTDVHLPYTDGTPLDSCYFGTF